MSVESNWYQNAIFYQVYPRSFMDSNGDRYGDFQGLISRLDYIRGLGVDCIWLQPTYPSPLRDDGYDISDYKGVYAPFGTIQDFKRLVHEVHARGMRLISDLVINHCSSDHPWFQAARNDPSSKYFDYFVWSDNPKKYAEARIIFVDSQSSNWAYDEKVGKYYWHRFYPTQPDLNFDNPAVREEMKDVLRFWLDLGIDGFRADAVPYLYEREGTNGENLPETHAYLKELRKLMDEEYPGTILLCEANQWPRDVRAYFGDGDEFQLGFHFPLMPRVFMSIGKEDASSLVEILNATPAIPANCQWCTFLRNHDELTLEMVSEEDRQWMWNFYAPDPAMRMNLGIRRRLYPLMENDRRRVETAYSLIFTLPGSPVLYYGDEIGMGDDITQFDRNGVRTPMQWDATKNGGFSTADTTYLPAIRDGRYGYRSVNVAAQSDDPDSNLNRLKRMIEARRASEALGWGKLEWLTSGAPLPVLAYRRTTGGDTVIAVHNLTGGSRTSELKAEDGIYQDLLDSKIVVTAEGGKLRLTLGPRQFYWLRKVG